MFNVIFMAVAVWAVCGAVAGARAGLAGDETTGTGMSAIAGPPSYGATQRAAYRRRRDQIRRGMPGHTNSSRPGHILADAAAATIAGAALFGSGFASGAAWATGRIGARSAGRPNRATRTPGGPRPTSGPGPRSSRARREPVIDGELLDPEPAAPPQHDPLPDIDGDVIDDTSGGFTGYAKPGRVLDAEIVEPQPGPATPAPPALPALPDRVTHDDSPEPKGPAMEILNIHQLFAWAKSVAEGAVQLVEHALLRKNAAQGRAERAAITAQHAAAQAAQLDQTQARFSALRMDAASLASIAAAIQTAAALAAAEQRHVQAEQLTAQTSADVAAAAEAHQIAVTVMHATVQAHQSPHAMAQAETGNAAAHSSVLAVS